METMWEKWLRPCLIGLSLVACLTGCSDSANTGKPKTPPKLTAEQALAELTRKAEAGDAQAQYELGRRYAEGEGVSKDAAKAMEWWNRAAEQGNADAQHRLGVAYHLGEGVKQDLIKAIAWTRKAAEQGNSKAQRNLGISYMLGEGMAKDNTLALEWMRKAAEQGNANAQHTLGWMYERGEGVPKDVTKAVEWYRKAADQGNADAQVYLGVMYERGDGVPKDAVKAVEWYRKAAEQGNAYGQSNLSVMYWFGRGVPQDRVRAYMWANLAAAQGDEDAIKNRELYERWMTPEQIAEAQRLAREWKPGQPDAAVASAAAPAGATAKAGTGTAFVVSEQGHLLTNRHVVAACGQVRLAGSDKPLKLLPQDAANDLALLRMADKPESIAVFRRANDLRQGESISIYGYPLEGALAAGGNLSPGVVSALAGLGNNTSQIQITAPVQPGNSGGPVLDGKGQVVGVVVQKLDAVKVAKLTGDVPQNVNFAINEATARAFLDSNQVPYKTGAWWRFWDKSLEDTAAEARKYTVVVECWK